MQHFWLQFGGLIMTFNGSNLISPSYSLFSSYTSAWHEMKAWVELTGGSGSMRWYDHSLFAAACCAHMCVHMCTWQVFDCYACLHVCASFQSGLALASEFPSRHLPPNYCCQISIQVGSPVGWEKWACTSISLAWKCYFPKSRQFSCLVKQETPAVIWMNNLTW